MPVHCSREQINFNFAYTFSVDIETLLLMKRVNRGKNTIEQYSTLIKSSIYLNYEQINNAKSVTWSL